MRRGVSVGERLKNFQKHADYLDSRVGGEKWTKMGRSPRRKDRVCRIVKCDGFYLSEKWFTAIKNVCDIFFCGLINSFKVNLFLYNSTILWFSKLSLFLVVSEIKCKWGNNKRLWPRWNFSWNNTLLSITM